MRVFVPAVAVGFLFCAGCVHIDTPPARARTETRTIERQGAETVQVDISMAAGELKLRGGAKTLLEADLRYTPESWRPEIKYEVTGFRGRLTVSQPHHGTSLGKAVSDWNLRLNDDIPLDVKVKLGAGQALLDLSSLTMRNLEAELGAGSLKLDLTGTPKKTMDVKVRGGVGEAIIRLPRDVGVEVEAHGGIGEITTSGLEKSDGLYRNGPAQRGKVGMRVSVHGGIGTIRLIAE